MSGQDAAIVLTVLAIGALVVWFDKRCLDDAPIRPVRSLSAYPGGPAGNVRAPRISQTPMASKRIRLRRYVTQ